MHDLLSEQIIDAEAREGERGSSSDARPLRGERALFFRHWLRQPLGIGAILPSGGAVARAMARVSAFSRPGVVLELGGGTGSITRALLSAGCPPERLLPVERERELAASLRRRLPAVAVVEADAADLDAVVRYARWIRCSATGATTRCCASTTCLTCCGAGSGIRTGRSRAS